MWCGVLYGWMWVGHVGWGGDGMCMGMQHSGGQPWLKGCRGGGHGTPWAWAMPASVCSRACLSEVFSCCSVASCTSTHIALP